MTEYVLALKVVKIKGNKYWRIDIPKRISNQWGLREGDKLRVEVKEILRPELKSVPLAQQSLGNPHDQHEILQS